MSTYLVGERVRVGLRTKKDYEYYGTFTDNMTFLSGCELTITEVSKESHSDDKKFLPDDGYTYKLSGNAYSWRSNMLEPTNTSIVKEDKEVYTITIGNTVFKGKISGIGSYVYLCMQNGNHESFTVDYIFKSITGHKATEFYSKLEIKYQEGIWPATRLEDLQKVLTKLQSLCNSQLILETTNPKTQSYVIKLQRTKASFRGAEVPKGSRICSKIHQTAISIEPLSYTKCFR